MRKRIFGIIGLLALIGHPAFTMISNNPAAGQGESGLRRFRLDLVAWKDGKPAGDLTGADLELYEDGKKIPLRSLSYVQTASQKRVAVIFHDMNLWIRNVQQDKDDFTEELVGLAGLGIELAIMRLDSPGGLKIIQPFTRDEGLIRKATASALAKEGMNESYDSLGGRFVAIQGAETSIRNEKQSLLLSHAYTKRQRFENTVGGLMAAGCFMQELPGRKSILLVSGGIPDLSSSSQIDVQSTAGGNTTMSAIHDRARQTMTRTRLFDPFGLLKGESFEQGDQVLNRLIQFSNSKNISIYGLDSGLFSRDVFMMTSEYDQPTLAETDSLLSEERAKEVQNLSEITEGTSGLFFRGANKFEEMKKSLGGDLEGHYELAFKPEGQKPDGAYHKIAVKSARRDVSLRYRKGYREYAPDEAKKMLLVSAYYSPDLFHGLPFEALFVPFADESGKFESWISLALPAKTLFMDTPRASSPVTTFSLFVWLRERGEESKGLAVNIDIPVKMTAALKDSLPNMTHIWSFFKGPEFAFKTTDYDVVYVLHDPQTGEIGGWRSAFAVPELRRDSRGAVVTTVLGTIAANPQGGTESMALNPKSGTLDFREFRFYPRVTNQFTADEDASVFLQVHLPLRKDKDPVTPRITAMREGAAPQSLEGEIIVESWNARTKIWSGVCRASLGSFEPGENILRITIPAGSGNDGLTAEIKFNIIR